MLPPDYAIDGWREWGGELRQRPVVRGSLNDGRSNHSFLLASGDQRMVLRLNSTTSVIPGSHRNNEVAIWKAASQQGIAPPLLYADNRNQFLVSAYIDNSLPSKPPLNEALTRQAIDLLIRSHSLKVETTGIDYASHVEHYWRLIKAKNRISNQDLPDQRKPMQSVLESLIASNSPTGLCHHDPVIANFVGSEEKLYLIDWEYAARGMVVMDFAALCVEWEIADQKIISRTGIERELLAKAKALYGYLCALWQETKN